MRGILRRQRGSDRPTEIADIEVRCDECGVTYPTGTRRCMYCGGRPGYQPMFATDPAAQLMGGVESLTGSLQPERPLQADDAGIEEEEAGQPRGSIFRIFGNLSWIVLFAALTLYRACTG